MSDETNPAPAETPAEQVAQPPVDINQPAEPAQGENAQVALDAEGGAMSAIQPSAEPAAHEAQQPPPAEDQVSEAVGSTDATPAESGPLAGQEPQGDQSPAAADVSEPAKADTAQTVPDAASEATPVIVELDEPVEPPADPPSPVPSPQHSDIAAELTAANGLLRSQLVLLQDALDDQRQESAATVTSLRSELSALVESQVEQLAEFKARLAAVEPLPVGGLRVFVRHPLMIGGRVRGHGETLAHIRLSEGVTLNFLVDAVRNGMATGG